MSSVIVDSITIGIPFSLNLASAAEKNVDVLSTCAFKRTFEVPNSSFVMELATDSLCSFTSDLLSNGTARMDTHNETSETYEDSTTDSDLYPPIPVEHVIREEEDSVSGGIPYDLLQEKASELGRRNASEFGSGSGSRSWRWRNSRSRDYSNAFHACKLDSLGQGSSLKLASSRASSPRTSKSSMESRTTTIPWPPTGHAAISRPTINTSLNLSTDVLRNHRRSTTSIEKSSEFDFWDYALKLGPGKSQMERHKRNRKWFVVKMLGCFCIQPHKRDETYPL